MRYVSGIQPSGKMHLGNYFGAVKPQIERQGKGESYFFVADYHALTSVGKPEAVRADSKEIARDYLALVVDQEEGSWK